MNIYVGNLSAQVTDDELQQQFTAFGKVTSVTIINGKYFGKFRGHGFVEMPSLSEGGAAIAALNKAALRDRRINVIEALPLSHKTGPSLR
jgi:RNA recognition motif-containing protein